MGQATAGKSELDLAGFTDALDAGVAGRDQARQGRAAATRRCSTRSVPALEALAQRPATTTSPARSNGRRRPPREGMEATVPLVARKGRASYLGERSAGHQDPGATSSHLLLKTVAEAVGSGGAAG